MQADLASLRFLFVTVASLTAGFGHLSRCLALAIYAQKRHVDISFLVFGCDIAKELINTAGFGCIRFDESALNADHWPQTAHLRADAVIADLLFPAFDQVCPDGEAMFRRLRSLGRHLTAIDVLGKASLARRFPGAPLDLLVRPYVVQSLEMSGCRWRVLQGARYALLSPEYAGLPPRTQRSNAGRVLVSCGGSDPMGYSVEVLKGLARLKQRLEVRVVIGPMFSASLQQKIQMLVDESRHSVTLMKSVSSLRDDMLWCDLAIGANGLTKYELAATATPSLLFSIDAYHDEVNRPFAMKKTAAHLGIGIVAETVSREAERLLSDISLRREMGARGSALVDGLGVQRLFDEINKELLC
jgi:UDP-2,4-diacetamido-2,4,6-trideoxy-beta-L-altropyranose hydrolase